MLITLPRPPFQIGSISSPRHSTYGWHRRVVYMNSLAVVVPEWYQWVMGDQSITSWVFTAITGAFVRSFLICTNSSSSLVPHFHGLPELAKFRNGLNVVEKPGINLVQNWADPRWLQTSDWFHGLGAWTMASTLLSEPYNPSPVSTSPMYCMSYWWHQWPQPNVWRPFQLVCHDWVR